MYSAVAIYVRHAFSHNSRQGPPVLKNVCYFFVNFIISDFVHKTRHIWPFLGNGSVDTSRSSTLNNWTLIAR
jgi:hypothetical protein